VREDGERPTVDTIDPHDYTKPDAVGKTKGLSEYAAKHADILRHIDLIAKIGTRYRRLHLEQLAVRRAVDALGATPNCSTCTGAEGRRAPHPRSVRRGGPLNCQR
jgi:hypothetical protein